MAIAFVHPCRVREGDGHGAEGRISSRSVLPGRTQLRFLSFQNFAPPTANPASRPVFVSV